MRAYQGGEGSKTVLPMPDSKPRRGGGGDVGRGHEGVRLEKEGPLGRGGYQRGAG